MPIYEFDCPSCGQPFEELVRSSEAIKDVVCPSCGNRKVKRKLSMFAAKVSGRTKSFSSLSAPACAPSGT